MAIGNWNPAPKAQLRLLKYLSLFLRKYRPTYLQACRDLCLWLNPVLCLNLNLNLNLNLSPSLCRELFAKSFRLLFGTFFASLFDSLFEFMFT